MKKLMLLVGLGLLCLTASGQSSKTSVRTSGGIYGNAGGNPRGGTTTSVSTKGTGETRWELNTAVGFSFSDNYFQVSLSPQIGYAITHYFVVGAGIRYNHYNYTSTDYRVNSLGGNVYARLYILKYITLHFQPEVISSWRKQGSATLPRTTTASAIAGAGLTFPVSAGSYVSAMLYYDVLQRADSPYGDRVFYSVGYGFRF